MASLITRMGAYKWTLVYIAIIPLVNWSFTWAPNFTLVQGWSFNPVTVVTGLVLVVRDFAQREIGHRILLAMVLALVLTVWLAGPQLALASGAAFAIAELVDWAIFTFTKWPLSRRVFVSSLIAAPIDSVAFLFGANFIRAGSFTAANIVMSVAGKMVGAVVVSLVVWRAERRKG
jgi:queuosine precursor transporter